MKIRVIKTEQDYQEALSAITGLLDLDPKPDSLEGEKLELLTTLVEDYEEKMFLINTPDPINAIKFRMEQQDLKPIDLIPYIGSKSKVSEILSRKRPLTISMIRALEKGLEIPANVLLKEPELTESTRENNLDIAKFPIKEMQKRGYFNEDIQKGYSSDQAILNFIQSINDSSQLCAFLKKTTYIRSPKSMSKQALLAWVKRVENISNEITISKEFKSGTVNLSFMSNLSKISIKKDAPLLVQGYLAKYGIAFVVEPHLSQTYIDGAVILNNPKKPIIGLTIRYDRLDNFWFTLMHELAHISINDGETDIIFDDLDVEDKDNKIEMEADRLAREALLPEAEWENSPAKVLAAQEPAEDLANTLGIHPAIVAGRMRYERKKYRYLNSMIGIGEVRRLFPNLKW